MASSDGSQRDIRISHLSQSFPPAKAVVKRIDDLLGSGLPVLVPDIPQHSMAIALRDFYQQEGKDVQMRARIHANYTNYDLDIIDPTTTKILRGKY